MSILEAQPTFPKVFVIGHNKCGTRSIAALFKNNGYTSGHWEYGTIARTIQQNFVFSAPLLSGIDQYICYSDMEIVGEYYAYRLFPLLDIQYPGSYFIYNYRSLDAWIKSRAKHGRYLQVYKNSLARHYDNAEISEKDVVLSWEKAWLQHSIDVSRYFEGRHNLIRFNIDKVGEQVALIAKLREIGFHIKDELLPHEGKTRIE